MRVLGLVCLKKVDVLVIVDATNEFESITLQLGILQKKIRELTRDERILWNVLRGKYDNFFSHY